MKILSLVVGLSLLSCAYADISPVILPFNEGQTLDVALSDTNINRISVNNDKIIHLTCEPGACSVSNNQDDPTGSAYVNVAATTPFNMYISTAAGHNLSLLVTPGNSAGATVLLQALSGGSTASTWETSSNYETVLVGVMTALIRDDSPDGYSHFYCTGQKDDPCSVPAITQYKNLAIKPVEVLSGEKLIGIHYSLQNKGTQVFDLYEGAFYGPGVSAVALGA